MIGTSELLAPAADEVDGGGGRSEAIDGGEHMIYLLIDLGFNNARGYGYEALCSRYKQSCEGVQD
jgi:hypothetical protein